MSKMPVVETKKPTLLVLLLGEGGFTSLSKIFRQGTVMLSIIRGLRTSTDIMNSVITKR